LTCEADCPIQIFDDYRTHFAKCRRAPKSEKMSTAWF